MSDRPGRRLDVLPVIPNEMEMLFEEDCPFCRATYQNIDHPLKPGVVMMRACKCEFETRVDGAVTSIIRKPPAAFQPKTVFDGQLTEAPDPFRDLVHFVSVLADAGVIDKKSASSAELLQYARWYWDARYGEDS